MSDFEDDFKLEDIDLLTALQEHEEKLSSGLNEPHTTRAIHDAPIQNFQSLEAGSNNCNIESSNMTTQISIGNTLEPSSIDSSPWQRFTTQYSTHYASGTRFKDVKPKIIGAVGCGKIDVLVGYIKEVILGGQQNPNSANLIISDETADLTLCVHPPLIQDNLLLQWAPDTCFVFKNLTFLKYPDGIYGILTHHNIDIIKMNETDEQKDAEPYQNMSLSQYRKTTTDQHNLQETNSTSSSQVDFSQKSNHELQQLLNDKPADIDARIEVNSILESHPEAEFNHEDLLKDLDMSVFDD